MTSPVPMTHRIRWGSVTGCDLHRAFGPGLLCFLLAVPLSAGAAPEDFEGEWLLALERNGSVDYGTIEFEHDGETVEAWIDGGPVSVTIGRDDAVTLSLDWSDSGDRVHDSTLEGRLAEGMITGRILEQDERVGEWRAVRENESSRILERSNLRTELIDLAGTWSVGSRGTHKHSFDLTPTGRAENEAYDSTLDDPHLRCVAGGLIRMLDGPFPVELVPRKDHLLVLFQYFEEQQRIYTDGRGFPDDVEDMRASMGYSIGHWEGSTLVVESRGLDEALWDAGGMPISTEARVVQRLYLDESGNLHNEITLHDPDNYERPVLRHAYWTYDPDAERQEYSCDPHSFYRALEIEGRLEEYWGRSETRR